VERGAHVLCHSLTHLLGEGGLGAKLIEQGFVLQPIDRDFDPRSRRAERIMALLSARERMPSSPGVRSGS